APDYDDWDLNGDLIVYYKSLDKAIELSSMGIRVDRESLLTQLEVQNAMERMRLPYHQALLNGQLPLTIGGGIGQSRLCMILLQKVHIGEVQNSIWPDQLIKECNDRNIFLL
ncbi:MAG TPA: aspartate--ammonia ligase, partial [Saprospiraceae bacterium]|nr:aspartate--ammonia ligase [Saprospiraceae bacterium]